MEKELMHAKLLAEQIARAHENGWMYLFVYIDDTNQVHTTTSDQALLPDFIDHLNKLARENTHGNRSN